MFEEFYTELTKAVKSLDPSLFTEEKAKKLFTHTTELSEKGKQFNLTAITDPKEVVNLHIADCLFAAAEILSLSEDKKGTLLDVGSGGGFPALPIACTLEDISVTALDATAKKCVFIADTAEKCGVSVNTISGRAEEVANSEKRESFDFVTARAVASLSILAELCLPFVKVGGYFVSMKGSAAMQEAKEAENAIKKLGAFFVKSVPYEIEGGGVRHILVYKKTKPTPKEFPRMYSKIKKKPL